MPLHRMTWLALVELVALTKGSWLLFAAVRTGVAAVQLLGAHTAAALAAAAVDTDTAVVVGCTVAVAHSETAVVEGTEVSAAAHTLAA